MEQLARITENIAESLRYDPADPLLFSSGLFLFLFAGFTFLYGFMRRRPVLRMIYVSLFSVYFYYKTSGFYFLLLVLVSITDFLIGRSLARTDDRIVRRGLVTLSVLVNLGMLAYFKYTNLLILAVNGAAGCELLSFRNIFLPVGISFFVFQSMSYTIDIYRRQLEPLRCWLDYFFYLSFFPQLVAGPIVRARDFIPQIRQNPLRVTRGMFGRGIFLIMIGLVKKAVVSDYVSINFVDRIFDDPLLYSGFENLMGVYGYALQIYCDFSGYSDMAIGIALLLGFRFPKNFDSPYKSATITEFWRRWHISLSTWLKDYLYISLGGNRRGRLRTYFNLIVTMLLGGLWHGAAVRFLLWGGYHGVLLAGHKMLLSAFPRLRPTGASMSRVGRAAGIVVTFHLVCLGWIFFRAPDMQTGMEVISQIFTDFSLASVPAAVTGYAKVFAMIVFGYALHYLPRVVRSAACVRVMRNPLVVNAVLMVVAIWVVMQVKSAEIQPFIYFQF